MIEDNYNYLLHEFGEFSDSIRIFKGEGTYFAWLKYLGDIDEEFASLILRYGNVRLEKGGNFGNEYYRFARITLACSRENLAEAVRRIKNSMEDIKNGKM